MLRLWKTKMKMTQGKILDIEFQDAAMTVQSSSCYSKRKRDFTYECAIARNALHVLVP